MSSGVIAAPAGAALLDVSFVDLVSEEVWADADPAAAAARTATRATRCASIIPSPELKDCCFSICGPALWSRTGRFPMVRAAKVGFRPAGSLLVPGASYPGFEAWWRHIPGPPSAGKAPLSQPGNFALPRPAGWKGAGYRREFQRHRCGR